MRQNRLAVGLCSLAVAGCVVAGVLMYQTPMMRGGRHPSLGEAAGMIAVPTLAALVATGGVMAAGMLPLHMRNGLRPEFLEKSGALLFIWTLYVLGVSGAFSVILAVQPLRARRVAS